jgi:hypothetical protein
MKVINLIVFFVMLGIYIVFSIKGNLSTTMFTFKLPVKKYYSVFTNKKSEAPLQNPLLSSSTKQSTAYVTANTFRRTKYTLFNLLSSFYKIFCIPV